MIEPEMIDPESEAGLTASPESSTLDAAIAREPDGSEAKIEAAAQLYLAGRSAFESGYYRQAIAHLERAVALSVRSSPVGGEMQIWLVLAYQAANHYEAARSLCCTLAQHPNITTRQQSRQIQAILEAPKLAQHPEWFSDIPDLSQLEESEGSAKKGAATGYRSRPLRPLPPPPIDPATINRRDNQFIWVAITIMLVLLAYSAWA